MLPYVLLFDVGETPLSCCLWKHRLLILLLQGPRSIASAPILP